jgi:hypothetical protein
MHPFYRIKRSQARIDSIVPERGSQELHVKFLTYYWTHLRGRRKREALMQKERKQEKETHVHFFKFLSY